MPSPPESPPDGETQDPPAGAQAREIDFTAVARISTQAELKVVRLKFIHADILANHPIPPDWTKDVLTGFVAEPHLHRPAKRLDVECGFLAVYAPGIDPEVDPLPNPKDAPVELHARFLLSYELEDALALDDTDPEHFALSNGVLHAWPYWREVAQTTTVRMGLTPLMVGLVKIPWVGDPGQQPQRSTDDASDA